MITFLVIESSSKRYIALGILLALLLIIIITIIVCRKHFQRQEKDDPKVLQYQELQAPTDTETEQINPSHKGSDKVPEKDPWNSDGKSAEQEEMPEAIYLGPLRSSEASGYCSLSEEGSSFEFKNNRTFGKATAPKRAAVDEEEALEYTELLTVV